jgi:hypothetical protein
MHIRQRHGAAVLVASLAVFLVSCSGTQDTAGPKPAQPALSSPAVSPAAADQDSTSSDEEPAAGASPEFPVKKVRDAFATLQATFQDGCGTPGNCQYFLTRLNDELTGLDAAMKADSQGPAHFKEPLAWNAELWDSLGGDTSFESLKKHQDEMTGVRGKINRWMQGHPEDYR